MNNNGVRKLLFWGRGGHASVCEEAAKDSYCDIEFISDDDSSYQDSSWLDKYPSNEWYSFVAIGNNQHREKVSQRLLSHGYTLVNIFHPTAWVSSSAKLGTGIYLGPQSVVHTNTSIGNGVIINTAATVDHDSAIGDYVHIAPKAALCGNVNVGSSCLIGVGSSIRPNTSIGHNVILGAGAALVDSPIPSNSVWLGVPARQVNKLVSESG